jgi:putative phosphoesterase
MKIAVIADTHDRLPPALLPELSRADEIWHLGDVVAPSILEQIEARGRPVKVVRGNCDSETRWPMTLNYEAAGLRFELIHIPPGKPPAGVDVVLHGHTHVPRNELLGGVRFLNPGCITRPNRGAPASFAWLEIETDGQWRWRPVSLASLE